MRFLVFIQLKGRTKIFVFYKKESTFVQCNEFNNKTYLI